MSPSTTRTQSAAGVNEQTFERTLVTKVMPLMPEVTTALQAGIAALDIGCGEGHSTNLLAQAFPHSRFIGYDLREGGLEEARAKAASLGLRNVRFMRQDLGTLEEREVYGLVTAFDVIHDQAQPMGPFLYTVSTMHCMTVSLARNGEGLGAMWGEQKALEFLAEAGFTDVTVKQVEGDPFNNFYIAKKH